VSKFDRCCQCFRVSEVVYSRVKPCGNVFATLHYCAKCAPEIPARPEPVARKVKTKRSTPPKKPKKHSPQTRSQRLKTVESTAPVQLASRLNLYPIHHIQGGGIVPGEAFHRRLNIAGAFAVQIQGTQTFQVVGSLSGVIVCKIEQPGKATFTSLNPVVHELLNRRKA
jgi:hypothetical protein